MADIGSTLSKYVESSELSSLLESDKFGIYSIKTYGAIGDGIANDTAAIQSAINAAYNNGGGIVAIPKSSGSYVFTRITNKTNVRLVGFGGVLKLKDNTCVNASTTYYLLENLGYSNCSYEGLIIDGNKANNTLFLVADGITMGGENTKIQNCWIYNVPDSGIMFSGAKNSIVYNNRIDTGSDLGIYVNDGDGTNHYENIIAFNRITGFPNGGIGMKRICQRTIVSENTIYSCGYGITLEQASTASDYSKNVTIIGNRIRNITVGGINLRASNNCVVCNNRIENFGGFGILLEGDTKYSSVTGNVVTSDGTITVVGTYRAAFLMYSRDEIFPSNNTITGNTALITNSTANNILALYLLTLESKTSGGEYNVISNNIFRSTSAYGARITSAYTKNNINDNVFSGSTNDLYIN
ncbi:MAG: Shigella phage, partial [Bacteroidota bacterium]